MKVFIIRRPAETKHVELTLPASKSISNRLLVMQYLSGGKIRVKNLSISDDTVLMQNLLAKIQSHISLGDPDQFCKLDCGNAGTVLRFLTALVASQPGKWILSGSERMEKRPVGPLCKNLQQLGASIEYIGEEGYPPIRIHGKTLRGGQLSPDTSQSSQFVSALLMIAPLLDNGLTIELKNTVASRPYIDMTLALMEDAGIEFNLDSNIIRVKQGNYNNHSFVVEPDWSSASYWFEVAALMPGVEIFLKGLSLQTLQGDAALTEIFSLLGIGSYDNGHGVLIKKIAEPEPELTYNFSNCPDLVPAVAATCVALNINATLSGLENLHIKESDRLQALKNELARINPQIEISGNGILRIVKQEKPERHQSIRFSTYNDHRMAMAFTPLALCFHNAIIENPLVVSKSYPSFWDDIRQSGFVVAAI
jgi:3-phosphoshikimate 1-carboxyvinyltransferase